MKLKIVTFGFDTDQNTIRRNFMRKIGFVFAPLLIVSVILTGCTKSSKEYIKLAQAGTTYATAVDNLLIASQKIIIDSNSEQLLDDRVLNLKAKKTPEQMREIYKNIADQDAALIKTISDLRKHTALLSRYFTLLFELGTSDTPERAQKTIGDSSSGLIKNLNSVSKELRGSNFFSQGVASAAGPITGLIFKFAIRKALKDELEARGKLIQDELFLQEKLLNALSKRIKSGLSAIKKSREERLVIGPFTTPGNISRDSWITDRRNLLTMELTSEQLQNAGDSIKKLREAFSDLGSNKLTLARFDSVVADFDALLAISEKLKG